MGSFCRAFSPFVLDNYISVKVASFYCGYGIQYLCRLLRQARLKGIKLGQVWFIDKNVLGRYLKQAGQATDNRFGPQSEHVVL